MAKVKTGYFCKECGYESSGWLGKCPACGEWNTFVESRKVTGVKTSSTQIKASGIKQGWFTSDTTEQALSFEDLEAQDTQYVSTGISELDLALGGGIVSGSILLFGGEPGIGKSTLLLQMCQNIKSDGTILYVCGEESPHQVKLRADRLSVSRKNIKLLPETSFEKIMDVVSTLKPSLVIIDSIQTVYSEDISSAPGTVSQIRDCTAGFLRLAKSLDITFILIGHVTKEGSIAGPRVLEHMVDTVMYFESDAQNSLRIVRSIKNRFGPANEVGIFEMTSSGLIPVSNPAKMLLEGRPSGTPGMAITFTMQGSRPLPAEYQALTIPSNYGIPQRMSQGFDRNRLSLLMAVGDKFLKAGFASKDIYFNIVGGLKIQDASTDLACLMSLYSSATDRPICENFPILGEIGLNGELRPISHAAVRIKEAAKLGFKKIALPGANRKSLKQFTSGSDIELYFIDNVCQASDILITE